MQRVIGLGGVFFKAKDAPALREWYRRHLGLDMQDWGGVAWPLAQDQQAGAVNILSVFAGDSRYFEPSAAPFMLNLRVADLDAVLAALRAEGCDVDARVEASEFGKFGWVMDPEGHRIELWQPPG